MTWSGPQYAVIPTNGRDCLQQCLDAIGPQVTDGVIINTNPDLALYEGSVLEKWNPGFAVIDDFGDRNVSRWWNLGIDWAAKRAEELGEGLWNVVVLNDDVIVPVDWVKAVGITMRVTKAKAGCSGGRDPLPVINRKACKVDLYTRLQGFAFMLAGESGIRGCEDIPWYGSDDYVDVCARLQGGAVMIPGYHVNHLYPNGQMTPETQVLNAQGMAKFVEIFGYHPFA